MESAASLNAAMRVTPIPLGDWLVILPIIIGFGFGAAMLIWRRRVMWQAPIAVVALAAMFSSNLFLFLRVRSEGAVAMTMGQWLPPFGISFTVDLLGAVFALAGSFVALCCGIAAYDEIDGDERRYSFFAFLVLTATGVNAAFLTGDVFNLYVWFEVFLIASFGMLVIGSSRPQLDGTMTYAVLNLIGTTLFLIATGYLYGVFGTLNMADLLPRVSRAANAPLMTLTALFLLAFCMKAAAFPVQAWLPASYHTPPAAASAFLGAVLTKVGIYAILRLLAMIFPVQLLAWQGVVIAIASATMLFAALAALAQNDIRRLFGFLVIHGVGVMLGALVLSGATAGALFYALHSMIALGAAYLLAGAIERQAGSTLLTEIGGLAATSPKVAIIALIVGASLAGLPFGSGLWPKVMIVRAAISAESYWFAAALLVSSLIVILGLGRFYLLAFWRPSPRGVPLSDLVGLPILAVLCVVLLAMGLWPEPFAETAQTINAGLRRPFNYFLAVFPER